MTATGTKRMVEELEQLTGLTFNKPNDTMFGKPNKILWPKESAAFSRRNVSIELKFNNSSVSETKSALRELNNPAKANNQFILYTNSVKRCAHLLNQAKLLMDTELIPGDLLTVNGSLFKEQKFHNTELFVGDDLVEEIVDANGTIRTLRFKPRGLFATAAGNAGLDGPRVRGVICDGFPPAMADLIQELGRPGRYIGALASENYFRLVLSLSSMYSLLF